MFEESCKQCGECCKFDEYTATAALEPDLERWRREGRNDIIDSLVIKEGFLTIPIEEDGSCKYLDRIEEKASCSIYETRPLLCELFPEEAFGLKPSIPESCVYKK